jgi:NAD(P)-dependent dehydrogenase (short-subunit alcohol dehydrogenase family)
MCSAGGGQRLAVVTGAGKGLGEALVHELSAEGWLVLAVVRQAVHAEALGADTDRRSPRYISLGEAELDW